MAWFSWMSVESKLQNLADRMAAACQEQVWQVVQQRAVAMSPSEARGYVRARAGLVVLRTVQAELSRSSHLRAPEDRLRDLTTDIVVRLVGAQLRAVRPARRDLRRAA